MNFTINWHVTFGNKKMRNFPDIETFLLSKLKKKSNSWLTFEKKTFGKTTILNSTKKREKLWNKCIFDIKIEPVNFF